MNRTFTNILVLTHALQATKCLESTLRILINITHDSPAWCRRVLESEMLLHTVVRIIATSQRHRSELSSVKQEASELEATEDIASSLLDRLCLALGVFTNMVQAEEDVKELIAETGQPSFLVWH